MTTREDGQTTRRWRSRAFLRPLLVTIIGFVLSVAAYLIVLRIVNDVSEGPCPYSADTCGYVFMGKIAQALQLVPVFFIGLVVTGIAVAMSGDDTGLAFGGLTAAIVVPSLGIATLLVVLDAAGGRGDALVQTLVGAVVVDLVLVIPMAIGFGVGTLLPSNSATRPDRPA